ncbi:MAG: hypothetical protein MJ161_05260 [Clostridia bacterium]|nr:hypothetical protein [Clostridia bacterium]
MAQSKWKPGIPEYTDKDRISHEELMTMAMSRVKEEIDEKGYEIAGMRNEANAVPNYIVRDGDKTMFIVVRAGVIPVVPGLPVQMGRAMLQHAEKFGAECYYASVAFGSKDDDRFSAGLLLRDDEYLCKYDGMKKVSFE